MVVRWCILLLAIHVLLTLHISLECCIFFRTTMNSVVSLGCHADLEWEYFLGARAADVTESQPMKLVHVNVEEIR
nr:hypothetical protein [Tanacetum cinerariifolium]